jgi:hypothetical protein
VPSLSFEQEVVAAIGAILLLGLLAVMVSTKAKLTLRRAMTIFVLAASVAVTVWTMGGAVIELGRRVTFVASCLSGAGNVAASIGRLAPAGGSELVVFGAPGTCEVEAFAAATAASVRVVDFDPAADLVALVGPRRAFADTMSARTLVFLFDPSVAGWSDVLDLVTSPTGAPALESDVFFVDVNESGSAYALNFTVTGKMQPVAFNRLDNPITLRLAGGLATGASEMFVDLCFSLDKPANWTECDGPGDERLIVSKVSLTQRQPGIALWQWRADGDALQDLIFGPDQSCKPAGCDSGLARKPLAPGWHTLQVLARFSDGKRPQYGGDIAPVNLTVDVGASGAVVIVGATESLAALGWPAPTAAPNPAFVGEGFARGLLTAAMDTVSQQRLSNFPRPPIRLTAAGTERPCILTTAVAPDLIAACLATARAVMLVEPDAGFLKAFATRAQELVARGVAITIAGVPEIAPADEATASAWLPAWPTIGTGVTVTARQVLVLDDCSGLAQMPIATGVDAMLDHNSPRPYAEQLAVTDRLVTMLRTIPDFSAPAVAPDDKVIRLEHKRKWVTSVTVDVVPGCLRDTTIGIESPRELVHSANLAQRIVAFLPNPGEPIAPPYPSFQLDGTRYPGSAIVIYSTRAAQLNGLTGPALRSGAGVAGGGLAPQWTATAPPADLLQRLRRAQIKVVIVELATNPTFEAKAASLTQQPGELAWDQALQRWRALGNVALIKHATGTSPDVTARAILQELAVIPASAPEVKRVHFGRTADPRTPAVVDAAPQALRPLTHVSREARTLQTFNGATLAAERNDKGAPVVTLAYNPFDIVVFSSDIASESTLKDQFDAARLCPSPCPLTSWRDAFIERVSLGGDANGRSSALGIQRYLDLAAQASTLPSLTNELTIDTVQIAATGDYLMARFLLPRRGSSWSHPTIDMRDASIHCGDRADNQRCPMMLKALDPQGATATYVFSTSAGLGTDIYAIRTTEEPDRPAAALLPLWLAPRKHQFVGASQFLNAMRLVGAVQATGPLPPATRSALPTASFLLLILVGALFSGLVRPWHALFRLLRRQHRVDPDTVFDADFVSDLAGMRPATYEASRRAGDPAWIRRMQAGDSLSRAVIADLATLTSVGRRVGAVMQRPRVHLREIGESFDVVVAIDDSPAMLLPGDVDGNSRKRFAAAALTSVISSTVARHRGRCSLMGLRGAAERREMDRLDTEVIDEVFTELFQAGGSIAPIRDPADLPQTAVRLIISDFLSDPPEEFARWTRGAYTGAIVIVDPGQANEIGIGRDPRSGRIYDRSGWARADAEDLLRRRREEVRYMLGQSGAVVATISVEAGNDEIAAILWESGILDLARQR